MLRKALATLPPTLDQTYERILCGIHEEDSKYAMRILQWLTFSIRPLCIEEMCEIVAIDITRDPAFDPDEVLEDPLDVLTICSSLITVTTDTNNKHNIQRPSNQIIVFAHYTVQEYLVSDRIKQGQAKQYSMQHVERKDAITKATLMYLMELSYPLTTEVFERFPLARYSARFWWEHLLKTEADMEPTNNTAIGLLSVRNPAYLTWLRLYDPDKPWAGPHLEKSIEQAAPPLYYAAILGLNTITTMLLKAGADVDTHGGDHGNALQAASFRGHVRVIELLLSFGADPNVQGGHHGNALQAASFKGHVQVVKLLLSRGADPNVQGGHHGNALQAASECGHEIVVRRLLDAGTNVNLRSGRSSTALLLAAARGYEQIVEMLLDAGADVNVHGRIHSEALQQASDEGCDQIIKIPFDEGIAGMQSTSLNVTALQEASTRGHKQMVRILLKAGADVNAEGGPGTALQRASESGHEHVVSILLAAGADISAGRDGTALRRASQSGHRQVVLTLLNAGANLDAQREQYDIVLEADTKHGHENIARLLLDRSQYQAASGTAPTDSGYASQMHKDDGDSRSLSIQMPSSAGAEPHFDDLRSLDSDQESIGSKILTTRSTPERFAIQHLAGFFMRLKELHTLHKVAVQMFDKRRFIKNYRRILKSYYRRLLLEATSVAEKEVTKVLRSRRNREDIVKGIIDRLDTVDMEESKPFGMLAAQPIGKEHLEDWLSKMHVAQSVEKEHFEGWLRATRERDHDPLQKYEHERVTDDRVSISGDSESEMNTDPSDDSAAVEDDALTHVERAEKFLQQGSAFRNLVMDIRLLMLPGRLREIVETTPKESIQILSQGNTSWVNMMKASVETYTGLEWDWWPLAPRVPSLGIGERLVEWKVSDILHRLLMFVANKIS
jgi:ankyrin repeat protein